MDLLSIIKLKLKIKNHDEDALITEIIEETKKEIIDITHNEELLTDNGLISQMAIFKYNTLDSGHLSGESYSGVNFNYQTDYPEPIRRILAQKTLLRCM